MECDPSFFLSFSKSRKEKQLGENVAQIYFGYGLFVFILSSEVKDFMERNALQEVCECLLMFYVEAINRNTGLPW